MDDTSSSADPLPPGPLAHQLAEVYRVLGPLYRKVSRTVERLQPTMGMSVGVRAVLEQLRREGPLTVPEMARSQELSRQFVQRMVHDATSAGWVQSRPNPAHRTSPLIRLTESGVGAVDEVVAHERALMGQVPGSLTGEDIAATLKVLTAMSKGLDDVKEF
ncbi:MarR family winged helix-turn-helix transcriptional regulator [Nesterenkonia haasae]|uniref:MarR family winged helix-turn-helix transcriptional regulator n=1 Tax=Nesterenkonia haasae TaxID=2587813 RepID=UPI001391C8C1|nr:MarR family winged helix-turn-helix transcriptional regulator [Nesterenkonia haasae]NDK31754.1 winged helix-turn-helix transcriptional regulator [Nesterenkonia haasae]